MRAYGSVSTLFAIVHRSSESTGRVGWGLYQPARGEGEDRSRVKGSRAMEVWDSPNRFYTGQELRETVQQHVELVGEGWIVIVRTGGDAGPPAELWPVRPDRMTPVPSRESFIAGYVYTGPDGEQVPLRTSDVLMLKLPNPLDPYRGMGPVQALLADLDAARFSAEWNRNFFLNSALPGGIIEVDRSMEDDEFDRLVTRWREQHQGVAQAHRVAVLEEGKWVERKFSMRDMQFEQLRNISREIIREAYGFPKPMLGAVDDVNRANAEAGETMFAKWLIVPRCDRWKTLANARYLPMFGPAVGRGEQMDYDQVEPPDRIADDRERTSKAQSAQLLTAAGYNPDDVAKAVGLPPMRHTGAPDPAAAAGIDTDALAVLRRDLQLVR